MKKITLLAAAAIMIVPQAALAKITLPSVLSDNMVLQQNTAVNFWGKSDTGKKVCVTTGWDGKKTFATPDADGSWSVRLNTPAGSSKSYEIKVSDGEELVLKDVLVGEVWYCGGQSNMEMPMRGYPSQPAEGATEYIVRARPERPIRMCTIKRCFSTTVLDKTEGSWVQHTPENVAETSATAYFFAEYLQANIDVPVGILVNSWGGSSIETWMDRETIEKGFAGEFDLSYLGQPWDKKNDRKNHTLPCLLWNGQVSPLVPFTFKGMIWYQGEQNRFRPEQYVRLMQSFVAMMRTKFRVSDAPFYFVQIAPYNYNKTVNDYTSGYLYEAQQKASELILNCGMAGTVDIGEYGTIHPRKKREVGMRLALLALVKDYGLKGIDPFCPTCKSVEFNNGKAIVEGSVELKEGLSPMGVLYEGFELAGADKVFHPAKATLSSVRNRIEVWSDEVPEPVALRYCFRNWAVGTVFNNFGIPMAPFRTDNWAPSEVR